MRLEGKFNCPIFACNKRSDDLANLMQHIRNGHNNKLNARYLIVDRSEGRVWMENRLPSKLQDNAKEQLERKEIGYTKIDNKEQLPEIAA